MIGGLVVAATLLTAPARAGADARVGLLVCDDAADCDADRAWVSGMGGGGPEGFALLDFDHVDAIRHVADGGDALATLTTSLAAAREAATNGRWSAAGSAAETGLAALRDWKGPLPTEDLFALWFIAGAAKVGHGRDQSWQYDLRQAAAIADGRELRLPTDDPEVLHAWLDEQRKLIVGGRGRLAIQGGPEGSLWYVDGRLVPAGSLEVLAGNHRVAAVAAGHLRTWCADVPVLPDRTSAVSPDFSSADEAPWVLGRIRASFATLDAPEVVKDLLVQYARALHANELRLLRVDEERADPAAPPMTLSEPPRDRPAAAAGEPVDMGAGIPLTYEQEVIARTDTDAEGHVIATNRLRVVFFDPTTRRFSMDSRVSTALETGVERFRVGLRSGYLVMMSRHHLGVDVQVSAPFHPVPAGPWSVEARLGVVRADDPYNLYATWVDRQLYHIQGGVRWAPDLPVAPYASGSAEVYIPAALGAHLEGGVQAEFAGSWRVELGADVGVVDKGATFAAGLGLSRGF